MISITPACLVIAIAHTDKGVAILLHQCLGAFLPRFQFQASYHLPPRKIKAEMGSGFQVIKLFLQMHLSVYALDLLTPHHPACDTTSGERMN